MSCLCQTFKSEIISYHYFKRLYAMQTKTLNYRCCFFSSLFCLFAAQLFGQNTNTTTIPSNAKKIKTQNAVKLFLEFKTFTFHRDYNYNYDSLSILTTHKNNTMGLYPSLAYSKLKPNGHFTETVLTFIQFQYYDDIDANILTSNNHQLLIPNRGEKTLLVKIGLRFDYNIPLFSVEKKQFYLGFSNEPIFAYGNTLPYTSSSFPIEFIEVKNIIAVMPRFIKNINKKIFLDFNVPISLFSATFRYENNKNPILPIYQQRKSTFETGFLPANFQFRMGVGMRI